MAKTRLDLRIGYDNWGAIGEYCHTHDLKGALVVSDANVMRLFSRRLQEAMGMEYAWIDAIQHKESKADYGLSDIGVILGLGGGTNIDQAKLFSLHNQDLPWLSILTKGTHAVVTPFASVHTEDGRASLLCDPPRLALVDLRIAVGAPRKLFVADYGEAMSSLTGPCDWLLGRMDKGEVVDEKAWETTYGAGLIALRTNTLTSRDTRERLIRAEMAASKAIFNCRSSRPTSGLEHSISHALDYLGAGVYHGTQVGLGVRIAAHLQQQHADLQRELEARGQPQLDARAIDERFRLFGCPMSAVDAGIADNMMIEAVNLAPQIRSEPRYTVLDRHPDLDVEGFLARIGIIG